VGRLLYSVIYSQDRKSFASYHNTEYANIKSVRPINEQQHNNMQHVQYKYNYFMHKKLIFAN